ncbi:MAG TPA: RtcB family protein [Candidatus Pacearchaeota archaeon]|nr:RtcB family protein [Candidatus Pacearchaeota archaeon]
MDPNKFKRLSDFEWQIPKSKEMNVPAIIFASEKLIREMDEKVWEQLSNVASLPGIKKAALAMADAHWGYGFPIGGVAAFDPDENGVISVGGVGFDAGCGVRSLKTDLTLDEVKPKIKELVDKLFENVPAGLGVRGKILLSDREVKQVLTLGAKWAVENGYGTKEDLEFIEDNGTIKNAKPEAVSDLALKREKKQVGTLGSGNHYLEVQYIDKIYDEKAAKAFGLFEKQIMVWIHCGSRALGHQVGTDYLKILANASRKYGIPIRDRELVCAPIESDEGKTYFGAVCAALNYAHANRQVIVHLVREVFEKVFPKARVETFYEISHNSCKAEKHKVDGKEKVLYVHRKGATRAFGPEREELPKAYRKIGQPVLIGGTMGTYSYILHGTKEGAKAFFSACHGAGRAMSRTKAKKKWHGKTLIKELEKKGVYVRCHSFPGLAEEAPLAYKPVEDVVEAIHNARLARKVVRLRPIGNIKG